MYITKLQRTCHFLKVCDCIFVHANTLKQHGLVRLHGLNPLVTQLGGGGGKRRKEGRKGGREGERERMEEWNES